MTVIGMMNRGMKRSASVRLEYNQLGYYLKIVITGFVPLILYQLVFLVNFYNVFTILFRFLISIFQSKNGYL